MNDQAQSSIEMPRYVCHKEVWALQIKEVIGDGTDQWVLIPTDEGYGPIPVDAAFVLRHKPEAGNYLVQYKDGYRSMSPAKAFEDGYKRI